MAVETFYVTNALASGSNHLNLQRGGTAPAVATIGTGWRVGTTVAARYALMDALVERALASFTTTVVPNAAPDNTLGDCLRTAAPLTGSFANANWVVTVGVIAVSNASGQDGRLRMDVWRSSNATGSGATKLTGAVVVSSAVTNLATATAQLCTLTWAPGGIVTLANEYLFFQLAWEITGAATNTNADVNVRVGNVSPSQTRVVTPTFTETLTRTALATATILTTPTPRQVLAAASIAYGGLTRSVAGSATITADPGAFAVRRSAVRSADQVRYGATGSKALTVLASATVKVFGLLRTVSAGAAIATTRTRAVAASATMFELTTGQRTVTATATVSGLLARAVSAAAAIAAGIDREAVAVAAIATPAVERTRTVVAVANIERQGVATSFDYWERGRPLVLLRGMHLTNSFDTTGRHEPAPVLLGPAVNRFGRQVPPTAAIATANVARPVIARAAIYARMRPGSFDYHSSRTSPLPYLVGRHATTSFDFAVRGEPTRVLLLGAVDRAQRFVVAAAAVLFPTELAVPPEAAIAYDGPILIDPLAETVASPVTLVWRGRLVAPSGTAHARVAFAVGHGVALNPDGSFGTVESEVASVATGSAFEVDESAGDDGTGPWVPFPAAGLSAAQQVRQQRVTVVRTSGAWSWQTRMESVVLS